MSAPSLTNIVAKCVVDTNVATTANGANSGASADCVAASAKLLQAVISSGRVFLDEGGLIVDEYRRNLNAKGQPGAGDMFLKWLLTHEWGGTRVTRVPITQREGDPEDFEELPEPDPGAPFDRSDRKFIAVAVASVERPTLLQSLDSKWWGWRPAMARAGVAMHFPCESEIIALHAKKMTSK